MNYGCADKVALISGGTSGIGLAAAELLLADGADVWLLARNEQPELMQSLAAKYAGWVHFVQADVTAAQACEQAVQLVAAASGRIDLLVNCAGLYLEQRLESLTEADFCRLFAVNVKGTMFLTKAVLRVMPQGGSIVNVASDAGISGNYGCIAYCASKGAVVAFTKALALDIAPGLRVNCVCPADVDTPLLERQLAAAEGCYGKDDLANEYPLERIGQPQEIAHVICSLLSPANSFMTGSIVAVDGGLTAK